MKNQLVFLLKLLLLSALLSALIKYLGPSLFIPATDLNALIIVLLPTVIVATILISRMTTQQQN
ncbi:hypothetical protein B6N60_03175 [Richelia sinica FACHB-800]|uniref:Uncharacterized protein n=1 Tax=Richelia sinica FACHB-800 TaxID=1357546 RepID=A0A975T9M8_9NOST|nr:hypothetical protein [Richelia sinica]MBD2663303.1 hypothetical protein [Richelia sinica FACHB-800]QXE24470.1 hypothetical protein B6N60_03175 [Richelia sinica FACHB-800]